ncbi:uncharacterized protein LOC126966760 [Leptidea sinapis]|uniref:uncharacterized protein LOC126966760 n=1 Tax=Leptidea sinapis TaxID=189913 RepID=UPI0021C29A1D|nr:uncharacterized protein LOC126966760 [Leptidea sinapis]
MVFSRYISICSLRFETKDEFTDTTRATDNVGHESDDDVIEVLRDEAPIEILSDGEELELQKSRDSCIFNNLVFSPFISEPGDIELSHPLDNSVTSIEPAVPSENIFAPVITNTVSIDKMPVDTIETSDSIDNVPVPTTSELSEKSEIGKIEIENSKVVDTEVDKINTEVPPNIPLETSTTESIT